MSNKEPFRFFDEGLADIIGGRFVGGEHNYKKKAFKRTNEWLDKGNVSFAKAQKWSEYFGTPPKVDFGAYMVGATFIYFIVENFGKEKLEAFFSEIGRTQRLKYAVKNVFSKNLDQFEKMWIEYIKKNK